MKKLAKNWQHMTVSMMVVSPFFILFLFLHSSNKTKRGVEFHIPVYIRRKGVNNVFLISYMYVPILT